MQGGERRVKAGVEVAFAGAGAESADSSQRGLKACGQGKALYLSDLPIRYWPAGFRAWGPWGSWPRYRGSSLQL